MRRARSTVAECWISVVAEYLDLMGVRYSLDRSRGAFEVFEDDNGKIQSLMRIEVLPSGYVVANTAILTVNEIPGENRLEVYEKLLEANCKMPEARYAIDNEGYVSVGLRSTVDSVTGESFRSLRQTLVNGVKYFFSEVAPDIPVKKPKPNIRRFVAVDSKR